jgi:hypothetical protein
MKLGLFFGVVTFALLMAYGVDLVAALIVLVPATFLLSIFTTSIFFTILVPFFKWLVK